MSPRSISKVILSGNWSYLRFLRTFYISSEMTITLSLNLLTVKGYDLMRKSRQGH